MSTGGDIVQAALEEIGVYAPGQTISAADMARAIDQFNKMLDLWSNSPLACFAIKEQNFALQVGVTAYTIGTGGTINQQRPLRILEGPGTAYLQDTNANNYAVNVVPRDVWNQIGNRGVTTQSNVPDTLFYDPQFPLGIINIWPSPTSTYTLYFDSYMQLGSVTQAGNLSFPPGYEAVLQDNLAVRCGPFFKNALVSQDVKDMAREGRMLIRRTNKRTNYLQYDPAIISRGNQTYNIFIDGYSTNGR